MTIPPEMNDAEDDVATLIREAGARPPVPAAEAVAIKAAARAEWQRLLAYQRAQAIRRRRRVLWGGLLAAAALLVTVWRFSVHAPAPKAFAPEPIIATFEKSTGPVEVDQRVAAPGERLSAHAVIKTAEFRANLRLEGGASLRLDRGTTLRLLGREHLALEAGALYVDAGGPAAAVLITTPFGEARDLGTRFEVRLEPDLRLRVRDGSVELSQAFRGPAVRGPREVVLAGNELLLTQDGRLSRRELRPFDPVWAWTLELLPRFEVEGHSLDACLAWAAAEAGWQLVYDDPQIAGQAKAIVLHGSIEGLSLEEALTVFVTGSGLRYEIRAGTLWIGQP